jgi:hypothetical protein
MLAEDRERLAQDRADIDAAKQELLAALSSGSYSVSQASRVFTTVDAVAQREHAAVPPPMTISGASTPSYLLSPALEPFPRPNSDQIQAQSFDAVIAGSQHPQSTVKSATVPKRPPPLGLLHSDSFKAIRAFVVDVSPCDARCEVVLWWM